MRCDKIIFFSRPRFVTLSLQNLALNAPGADLCDSVPVWDRLPCAPSPTTQGGCKELGCCYNAEGNSCYYGNTGE